MLQPANQAAPVQLDAARRAAPWYPTMPLALLPAAASPAEMSSLLSLQEENRILQQELSRVEDLLAQSRAERDELAIKYNAISERVGLGCRWGGRAACVRPAPWLCEWRGSGDGVLGAVLPPREKSSLLDLRLCSWGAWSGLKWRRPWSWVLLAAGARSITPQLVSPPSPKGSASEPLVPFGLQ